MYAFLIILYSLFTILCLLFRRPGKKRDTGIFTDIDDESTIVKLAGAGYSGRCALSSLLGLIDRELLFAGHGAYDRVAADLIKVIHVHEYIIRISSESDEVTFAIS